MNYFAHGRRFINDPYYLAGTAVPDWLIVADRQVRTRPKHVAPFASHDDPRIAALARGILQHHTDDAWFHVSPAFYELSTEFTTQVRAFLPADGGFRASFLGHILVELLLDGVLIAEEPGALDAYYTAVASVEPRFIEQAVNQIAPRSTNRLAWFIERFLAERFLSDYADDGRLLVRMNQVMRRAGLPQLPEAFCELFPAARRQVHDRRDELTTQ